MITRIAKVLKLTSDTAFRSGRANILRRILLRIFHPSFRMDIAFKRFAVPSARNPLLKLARLIGRNGRNARPFTALLFHKRQQFNYSAHHRFTPLIRIKKAPYDALGNLRSFFSGNPRYNKDLQQDFIPTSLDGYDIGENIGYGNNAAVYALRVRPSDHNHDELCVPSTSKEAERENSLKAYPLALKLMFNYELDRRGLNDDHLWRDMGAELVPLPGSAKLLRGRMGNFRPLPRNHPNIIRILTAFVDRMPLLPDARDSYPEALPTAGFYEMLIDEPRTLLVVMKRYRMTLRDYVITHRRNYWCGRVMLGQLLEGCAFLHDNNVSQRDMKSDNILLDFDDPEEVPHLVISDFGCALTTGSFEVEYREDTIGLGGNLATRAPEIRNAKAGPQQIVNFCMADTWASGGLAYEIFTRKNPFYSQLHSGNYIEEEVPQLPSRVHYAVKAVVKDLLRKDSRKRVKPHVAANVVALSLFRFGSDVKTFFEECGLSQLTPDQLKESFSRSLSMLSDNIDAALDNVLSFMAAETMIARSLDPPVVSSAELQLRATFLSRVNRDDVWKSIGYFFNTEREDRISLNTISLPASNGITHKLSTFVNTRSGTSSGNSTNGIIINRITSLS